jgi:hypothetical protein
MPLSWIARGAASAERGRRLMQLRGVTPNGHPLWAGWEVAPVIGMYPDYGSIFPILVRRTRPAVYSKASSLGVAKPRAPAWSDNEILRLRKVYPSCTREEIMAELPGRTFSAIARMASQRHISRSKPSISPTGIRILDQILERARRFNYSMSELDKLGRAGRYFTTKKWRSKPNDVVHYRVARALGGNVRAAFK